MNPSPTLSLDDLVREIYTPDRIWKAPVELQLGGLPRVYTPEDLYEGPKLFPSYSPFSLRFALEVLCEDLNIRGQVRFLIRTALNGTTQVVTLDQGGEGVLEDRLRYVNETVQLILRGQELSDDNGRFRPSGTRIAARVLRRFGGNFSLENVNEGIFRVRTKICLPLPS